MAKNLGQRIKAFRLSQEMTQPKVAVLLGVSLATLQRLENGARGSDLSRARIENRLKSLTERVSEAA
jgi:transcriptional regulator with XRE-family HTH domain